MATNGITDGGVATVAGTYQAPNLNIPYLVPGNVPQNLIPIIQPIYTAFQNIVQTLILNAGIAPRPASSALVSADDPTAYLANNVHRFYAQSTGGVNYGAAINLANIDGEIVIVPASAEAGGLPAQGFCSTVGGIQAGAIGEVILGDGIIFNLGGLEIGKVYYLSDETPGTFTPDIPTNPTSSIQPCGYAITETALIFRSFGGLENTIPTTVKAYFFGLALDLFVPSENIFEIDCSFPMVLPAGLVGSSFKLDQPPTNNWTAKIYYNGVQCGALFFAAGAASVSVITFETQLILNVGDNFKIQANTTTDASAQGFRTSLVASKGFS